MSVYRALLRALLERAGWGRWGSGVSSPVASQLGEIWAWLACGKLGKRSRFSVIPSVFLVCCFLKGGMRFFEPVCSISVEVVFYTAADYGPVSFLFLPCLGIEPRALHLPSRWAGNLRSSGNGSSCNLWLLIPSFWKKSWDTGVGITPRLGVRGQERVGLALVSPSVWPSTVGAHSKCAGLLRIDSFPSLGSVWLSNECLHWLRNSSGTQAAVSIWEGKGQWLFKGAQLLTTWKLLPAGPFPSLLGDSVYSFSKLGVGPCFMSLLIWS